jgi:hypothetical protein
MPVPSVSTPEKTTPTHYRPDSSKIRKIILCQKCLGLKIRREQFISKNIFRFLHNNFSKE